jgi:hypothetical protein
VISGPSSPIAIADAIRETAVLHGSPPAAHARSWGDYAREMLDVYRLTLRGLRELEPPPVVEGADEPPLLPATFEQQGRIS